MKTFKFIFCFLIIFTLGTTLLNCSKPKEEASISGNYRIGITPDTPMVDEKISIKLFGFEPGELAMIHVRMKDDAGILWQSHGKYIADEAGTIYTERNESIAGTYTGVDQMGLFWSMVPAEKSKKVAAFTKNTLAPIETKVSVTKDGQVILSESIPRRFISDDITMMDINNGDIVAKFFSPNTKKKLPTIIVLGGSRGGFSWSKNIAALLASHGFATLSLAYFDEENLPEKLINIPLDYFAKAIFWLKSRKNVDPNKIGVIGISKGAELSLILGSSYPIIKAVAAYSPSSVIFQGTSKKPVSSWTFANEPLPFVPLKPTFGFMITYIFNKFFGRPIALLDLYENALQNKAAVEKATIMVENINGPILLISGRDDKVWPSYEMSQMIMNRLAEKQFINQYEHSFYHNAGHVFNYPYVPTTVTKLWSKNDKIWLKTGGKPKATSKAIDDSWTQIITFFENAFE